MARLALGIDSSTQSITAVAVEIDSRQKVFEKSIDYLADQSLKSYGIGPDYLLPPAGPGEAKQPAQMFFASLDALFGALAAEFPGLGLACGDIVAINVSGQQHGHVLLEARAGELFASLRQSPVPGPSLAGILGEGLALPFARIWRTSNTAAEAESVRRAVGGKEALIRLTGSDAPLRFSAFGIRRTALEHPEQYAKTVLIHQISSLIPAALTGRLDIPLDWGNACGTSLMDYRARSWSPELAEAVAGDLPGGATELLKKLPRLASGRVIAGKIARYFVERYGFSPECLVGIGSGDNPQTKALTEGSLLSLGTSFVIMVETDGATFDLSGSTNAMYDSLDRPFTFGCRTNGALRWDEVRAWHGLAKGDYAPAELALGENPPGNLGKLLLWQSEAESFPVSKAFAPVRIGYDSGDLAADYAGIIESTLAAVYINARHHLGPGGLLYVSGGASKSPEIMRRAAAIFNRTLIPVEAGGAALGAAASGAAAWLLAQGEKIIPGKFCASFLEREKPVVPRPEDIEVYHGAGGYLEKYQEAEERILS